MSRFKIAGIPIEVTGINSAYFDYRMRDYADCGCYPRVVVDFSEKEDISKPTGDICTRDDYRVFLRNDDKYINYDVLEKPPIITALVESDKDWKKIKASLSDVEDYGGASLNVRSFNMVGEIMKTVYVKNNGVVIHSSSISYKNNGIIFSAPSGTGKSTHTSLWREVYKDDVIVVNDDMPAVRKIDGVWNLCGTPWSGKSEVNVNLCVPLRAIVFLERGEQNEIKPVTPLEGIIGIMNQTMLPMYKEIMDEVTDIVGEIVSSVPVYRLKCNISKEAPQIVKEMIFNENKR